jgi:hypothetical protein
MKQIVRFVLAAALMSGVLVVCTACVTQFDAASAAHVQTIAVRLIEEQPIIAARQFVQRVDITDQGDQSFSELMARQNLHLGAELKTAIARELGADGYSVIDDPATADAVLEFTIGGIIPVNAPAYAAAATSFEPEYTVRVTLRDRKTQRRLFHRLYLYRDNTFSPLDGSLLIRPDPKYSFSTAEVLFNNPAQAAEGFRAGLSEIAKSVGVSLRRP